MKTKLALLAFAAIVPFSAMAQFDFGGGAVQRPAWESFTLPNKKIKLDFRNANVDMVLSLFTRTSGITIVKDPALTAPMTLTSAKEVPLKEAFEILNAALSVRNFELRKEGNLLVVRPRQQQRGGGQGGFGNMTPDQIGSIMSGMSGGNPELKVYQIQFANASQVARVVNEVFVNSGQNPLQGLMSMFMGMQAQNRGRGGFNPGMMGGGAQASVRASSDDYSNTVIVNAPRTTHTQIENLIKQIDKQAEDPSRAKVYKLTYATASEMQPVIQNLLNSNRPLGRGGQSANVPVDRQFSGFGGLFNRGGGQNNQTLGSAIAEARTNSLIVTTTPENHELVAEVVKELDTEIKMESNTFVFPLENARADQVANLLRSAFGNRSGTGGNNFGTGNNRNQQNTNQNRGNQNRNFGGGGFGGGIRSNNIDPNASELELLLEDENLSAGELLTTVGVQGGIFGQFFGGGQGGGGQNQQNRQNVPVGRDASGRLVPVQDLTNQITVIPDQNTNSLIVVTTPENAALIRSLLGQLDRIPEQVMIETIIVEASLDSSSKLGIEWQDTHGKVLGNSGTSGQANQDFGLRTGGLPQGFRYTLSGGNLTAFMNALKTDTKFNVLSTPRIFTSNNVQAQINISQRVPFVVSQRTDANGNITFNYDFEDVGIVLTVTPRITAGGYVTMDVNQTANDLQGFTSFNAPIVNQRQAQTTVAVKDSETIILGGIIRSTVSTTTKKIPLLGDIPVLGNLFRSTDKTDQKTELLVFLTPRVVRDPAEASKLTDEQRKKLSMPTQEQLNKSGAFGDKTNTNNTQQNGGGR